MAGRDSHCTSKREGKGRAEGKEKKGGCLFLRLPVSLQLAAAGDSARPNWRLDGGGESRGGKEWPSQRNGLAGSATDPNGIESSTSVTLYQRISKSKDVFYDNCYSPRTRIFTACSDQSVALTKRNVQHLPGAQNISHVLLAEIFAYSGHAVLMSS